MHDGFSHPVDILGAFSLALLQSDVADHLGPAGIQVQLLEVFPELLLLLAVLTCPLPFFLLFLVLKLLELRTSFLPALLLVLPFLILSRKRAYAFLLELILHFLLFLPNLTGNLILLKVIELIIGLYAVEVEVALIGKGVALGPTIVNRIYINEGLLVLTWEVRPNSMGSYCGAS